MKKIIAVSLLALTLTSCFKDNFRERHPAVVASNCDTTTAISYSISIKPILDNNCTSNCHNGSGPGHTLTNWAAVNADAAPGYNGLYGSVDWLAGFQQMPQGGAKLSVCDITKIKKWAAAGAPNN